ncbi:MAG: hypothetical protein K9W43_12905 [Candidatus Thorarchaeota archaeon]|nr:hypothetical protein [Candidatus Thorarchaeota archaeon]
MEIEQIHSWLKLMQLPFTYDENTLTFKTEYNIEGKNVPISIIPHKPDWIKVKVQVMALDKVPEEKKLDILKALLIQNYMLDDVTFSMDESCIIYSENDIPRSSNLENFHSELTAVVLGTLTFVKNIAPKFGIDEADMLLT